MRKFKILTYDIKANVLRIGDVYTNTLKEAIRSYDRHNIWWELADNNVEATKLRDELYKKEKDFFHNIEEHNRQIDELNKIIGSHNSTEEDVNRAKHEKMKVMKKRQQLIRNERY